MKGVDLNCTCHGYDQWEKSHCLTLTYQTTYQSLSKWCHERE